MSIVDDLNENNDNKIKNETKQKVEKLIKDHLGINEDIDSLKEKMNDDERKLSEKLEKVGDAIKNTLKDPTSFANFFTDLTKSLNEAKCGYCSSCIYAQLTTYILSRSEEKVNHGEMFNNIISSMYMIVSLDFDQKIGINWDFLEKYI